MHFRRNIAFYLLVILFVAQAGLHRQVFFQELTGFHVWRQTQTQTTINNFAQEDFNILNPRRNSRGDGDGIFRMEFPLMQWVTAIPVRFLGNSVLVSRSMSFLFAFIGIAAMYKIILFLTGSIWIGLAAAFFTAFSPVMHYYMVNPMPDNLALSTAILGLYFLAKWFRTNQANQKYLALSFIGLAALIKLPYVLYFGGYIWMVLFPKGGLKTRSALADLVRGGLFSIPCILWYLRVIPEWEGNGIVQGIFSMGSAQRELYWYYVFFHIRTTLPELLLGWPLVPFFLGGLVVFFKRFRRYLRYYGFLIVPGVLSALLLLFEMNMIEKVHDYYFLPLLPMVLILTIAGLLAFIRLVQPKFAIISLMIILIAMPVYSSLRINGRWERTGFNTDLLIYRDELRAAVPGDALVCVGNDISTHIFLYYIDKKGWTFGNNWMNSRSLSEMIDRGCRFLYTDSREIDQNPEIARLFGMKVAEYGSIRIYELKKI